MKHIHHIIPRHAGGTNDPSNLIELTVEEHAEAHRKLYEEYGRYEDKVAYLCLSAQIGNEAVFVEKSRIGGRKNKGVPKTQEHKKKISENHAGGVEKHTAKTKEKISMSMLGNTNSKNHLSDEYRRKQSEAMKLSWARRKNKTSV